MRLLALCLLFIAAAGAALARDCAEELDSDAAAGTGTTFATRGPSRGFYLCLLAEIEDLKDRQAELERIIPEYERLIAELPAHYSNRDGVVTHEEGRAIGSASFILTSRQLGGANSLKIDQIALDSVCPSPRGCSATLTYRRFGVLSEEPLETQKTGPCAFEYDAQSHDWIRGAGCGSDSSMSGADGDGNVMTPGSGAGLIIKAGPGCVFSDADIRQSLASRDQPYEADHSYGFFLIADPSVAPGGATRFECDLEIR